MPAGVVAVCEHLSVRGAQGDMVFPAGNLCKRDAVRQGDIPLGRPNRSVLPADKHLTVTGSNFNAIRAKKRNRRRGTFAVDRQYVAVLI